MGFRWPVPRRDLRGTSGASLTAAALTVLGAAVMSGPLAPLYRIERGGEAPRIAVVNEVVTFIAPAAAPAPPGRRSVDDRVTRASPAVFEHRRLRGPAVDSLRPIQTPTPTSSSPAVTASEAHSSAMRASDGTRPSPGSAAGGASGSRNTASLVFLHPSPFARSTPLSPAQRDSALYHLSRAVPRLAATRRPTQAERDSLWREEARRQAMWREQGRPIPIIGGSGSGSLSLPLFSLGRSREERTRDSVVHHDNLRRLERIAERARAKRDTTGNVAARPDAGRATVP